jgi:hypothetical protein
MQTYEIEGDLNEQRQTYLATVLIVAALISIPLFSVNSVAQAFILVPWLCSLGVLALSCQLGRRQPTALSSWAYVGGLSALFSLHLWYYGPADDLSLYFAMLLSVVLASLLSGNIELGWIGILSIELMFGITVERANTAGTLQLTVFPAVLCVGGLLTSVITRISEARCTAVQEPKPEA